VYYEIDLASILEREDLEAFKYFYYFFRQEAFLSNEMGEIFLEVVLKGSADYAQEIGENLKENVYRAMKKIAEGFFTWRDNGLDFNNPVSRALVQKNTMILLYRFLFLLYAEGKSLLNLRDERYREFYSFDRIKKSVASREDGPQSGRYLASKTSLLGDLRDLFRVINLGSKEVGIEDQIHVPAYNGGLFDPDKHPDLERWTIGDAYLADAIDLLSRSELNGRKKGFVDYSTLEIRHLGSIYEGLLEYKLEVAEDDLVVTKGKERKWLSPEEFNKDKKKKVTLEEIEEFDRARKGQMYLTTDKGERKATGSYYTPDYIVNYIVENTVDPVVEERWKQALLENRSLIEATLSVKVLDPAMGSGHFLVGAVEFLASKLMAAAERDIEWGWVEDRGQFTSEWAKREVVSHCIYGVDLNELAVELAKVSLWLITIAKEKPLSFLDHRLKQGNSLIGAKLSDLKHYPGNKDLSRDQVTLPSFVSPLFIQHLISKIKELEGIGEDTLSEIKRKEEVFEEFKRLPEYTRARNIANVHTSVYFGNEVTPVTREGKEIKSADGVYHDLFWAVGGDDAEWRRKTFGQWFQHAQKIAEERHFFHWELEFPEIFFEAGEVKKSPGFEVVIGNPPYYTLTLGKNQVRADELELAFFETIYTHSSEYKMNTFALFSEKALLLLREGGQWSYILPNTILTNYYLENIRNWILNEFHLRQFIDLRFRVFEDAETGGNALIFAQAKDELSQSLVTSFAIAYNENYLTSPNLLSLPQFVFAKIPNNNSFAKS
jgi:type I restriction-modification system DNA methylase subunit